MSWSGLCCVWFCTILLHSAGRRKVKCWIVLCVILKQVGGFSTKLWIWIVHGCVCIQIVNLKPFKHPSPILVWQFLFPSKPSVELACYLSLCSDNCENQALLFCCFSFQLLLLWNFLLWTRLYIFLVRWCLSTWVSWAQLNSRIPCGYLNYSLEKWIRKKLSCDKAGQTLVKT